MPIPPPASDRAVFDSFLARRRLDPDEYKLQVQQLSQPSPWEGVDLFVTVTCASLRICRTYASGLRHGHWLAEFAQDVEGGVFHAGIEAPAPRVFQATIALGSLLTTEIPRRSREVSERRCSSPKK